MPEQESLAAKFLEHLRNIAEDLGLEDDEAEGFINSSMERKGFKKTFTWADPEPESGSGGGDFFSLNKGKGQTRQVGGQQRRDSFYGS